MKKKKLNPAKCKEKLVSKKLVPVKIGYFLGHNSISKIKLLRINNFKDLRV